MIALFHSHWYVMLILLVFFHFLADYPLQGPYLSESKNHLNPLGQNGVWKHSLFAHSFIHAGFVFIVTGSLQCFLMELVVHAWTDYGKCQGWLTLNMDQSIHIGIKVLYVFLALNSLPLALT